MEISLNKKEFTLAQLIVFTIGIIIFVFWETSLFKSLPDIAKIILYVALLILSMVFGISFVDMKSIGMKMKELLINEKGLSDDQLLREWGNLAVFVLTKLNEAWDLVNSKPQIEEPKTE